MGVGERRMGSTGVPGWCLQKDQTLQEGCCLDDKVALSSGPKLWLVPPWIWATHLALGF